MTSSWQLSHIGSRCACLKFSDQNSKLELNHVFILFITHKCMQTTQPLIQARVHVLHLLFHHLFLSLSLIFTQYKRIQTHNHKPNHTHVCVVLINASIFILLNWNENNSSFNTHICYFITKKNLNKNVH